MPVSYDIQIAKNGADVGAKYDLSVPIGGSELIADFQLFVDGENLIKNFEPGQTRFKGATFHKLPSPDQDATVSFAISSNQAWVDDGSDVLRGSHKYDDVCFKN